MSTELEERLMNLEIRYTHQEDTVESLSTQVHELQEQVALLKAQLKRNHETLRSLNVSNIATLAEETPPPHY
ncbi:MAG: SlyX family protein [bacterium]